MIIPLLVHSAVWSHRAEGAFMMLVAVQLSVPGLYRPPVFIQNVSFRPPQTIISMPVQTAVWEARAAGALAVLVAVQVSVVGLYRPPVFNSPAGLLYPPQKIGRAS